MKISLCMIVKNEESTIKRCLQSVKDIVDEIIIVDTGSDDNTVEICKSLGAIVYNFEWIDDFSKARNFAFSKATKDYILWLDADDILNKDDIEKFKNLKDKLDKDDIDSVTMNYGLSFDEDGKVLYSLKRNRLVKRSKNFEWIGRIHEFLNVTGNIIHEDILIIHKKEKEYSDRNLKIYEKMIEEKETFSARDKFYFANELFDNKRYEDAIIYYKEFLTHENNYIEDTIRVCTKLSNCYNILKDSENELKYIFKSFEYDVPRPDFCCTLGFKFLSESKIDMAIYWYSLAISYTPPKENMSLINHDTYTYLPWIQLCVCYSKKGDLEKSYICNEMAKKYKPNDYFVTHNEEFLKDKVPDDVIQKIKMQVN